MSAKRPHIAILGAGPVGLEAALAAAEAGHPFTVYEQSGGPGAAVAGWGHVRLFSPWDLDVSPRQRRALAAAGADAPSGSACPTGRELIDRVLAPVAGLPEIAPRVAYGTRVLGVGRQGLVKHQEIANPVRAARPFRLLVADAAGERVDQADVVLDCTGTWGQPNRLGDGGIPALGESALDGEIRRHVPDFAAEADEWAGRTVFLAGSGHSAQTAACALAELAAARPGTRVLWAVDRAPQPIEDDPLPERARLMRRAGELAEGMSAAVEALPGARVEALARNGHGLVLSVRLPEGGRDEVHAERVLSLTGYVGDPSLHRQLQVHQCYATEGPMKLSAALLGAAGGDCLAAGGHGVETLKNPEPGFFLLGSKSYGRNASFLMRAGWQQVDEVFADLAAQA
ncbi:MAG TPA: flavoprotein [Thermoanaerobaculia bacterium]|nr:flavoprotein [Thermoanaerobaculia bacterium]